MLKNSQRDDGESGGEQQLHCPDRNPVPEHVSAVSFPHHPSHILSRGISTVPMLFWGGFLRHQVFSHVLQIVPRHQFSTTLRAPRLKVRPPLRFHFRSHVLHLQPQIFHGRDRSCVF